MALLIMAEKVMLADATLTGPVALVDPSKKLVLERCVVIPQRQGMPILEPTGGRLPHGGL